MFCFGPIVNERNQIIHSQTDSYTDTLHEHLSTLDSHSTTMRLNVKQKTKGNSRNARAPNPVEMEAILCHVIHCVATIQKAQIEKQCMCVYVTVCAFLCRCKCYQRIVDCIVVCTMATAQRIHGSYSWVLTGERSKQASVGRYCRRCSRCYCCARQDRKSANWNSILMLNIRKSYVINHNTFHGAERYHWLVFESTTFKALWLCQKPDRFKCHALAIVSMWMFMCDMHNCQTPHLSRPHKTATRYTIPFVTYNEWWWSGRLPILSQIYQ